MQSSKEGIACGKSVFQFFMRRKCFMSSFRGCSSLQKIVRDLLDFRGRKGQVWPSSCLAGHPGGGPGGCLEARVGAFLRSFLCMVITVPWQMGFWF